MKRCHVVGARLACIMAVVALGYKEIQLAVLTHIFMFNKGLNCAGSTVE